LRRQIFSVIIVIIVISIIGLVINVKPAKAAETIYIRADGGIDPPTANITSSDNVTYYFTDNNYDEIFVERSNIVIDGNGYTLQGLGSGYGFNLTSVSNVTIRDANIRNFGSGVYFYESDRSIISANNITNNMGGIHLESSSHNSFSANNITDNEGDGISLFDSSSHNFFHENRVTGNEENGIYMDYSSYNNTFSRNNVTNNYIGVLLGSSNNRFYHNHFIGNIQQVSIQSSQSVSFWDDGYPSGGNYWSDYIGIDLFSGPYQNITGSDGIGDTPYVLDENNQDNYPLIFHMPWDITGPEMWVPDGKCDIRDVAMVALRFGS